MTSTMLLKSRVIFQGISRWFHQRNKVWIIFITSRANPSFSLTPIAYCDRFGTVFLWYQLRKEYEYVLGLIDIGNNNTGLITLQVQIVNFCIPVSCSGVIMDPIFLSWITFFFIAGNLNDVRQNILESVSLLGRRANMVFVDRNLEILSEEINLQVTEITYLNFFFHITIYLFLLWYNWVNIIILNFKGYWPRTLKWSGQVRKGWLYQKPCASKWQILEIEFCK